MFIISNVDQPPLFSFSLSVERFEWFYYILQPVTSIDTIPVFVLSSSKETHQSVFHAVFLAVFFILHIVVVVVVVVVVAGIVLIIDIVFIFDRCFKCFRVRCNHVDKIYIQEEFIRLNSELFGENYLKRRNFHSLKK